MSKAESISRIQPRFMYMSLYSRGRKHEKFKSYTLTIAYKVEHSMLHLGIACCSPKDTFVKKIGRQTALERLGATPLSIPVKPSTFQWQIDETIECLLNGAICNSLIDITGIPKQSSTVDSKKLWYIAPRREYLDLLCKCQGCESRKSSSSKRCGF